MLYQPQILFDDTALIRRHSHTIHVTVYHAEIVYGDVGVYRWDHDDSLREAEGVGGGVEGGSSAVAAWPAALAARM